MFPRRSLLLLTLVLVQAPPPAISFAPSSSVRSKLAAGGVLLQPLRLSSLSVAASSLPEGIVKTVTTEGKGRPINLGDIATVKYTCYLPNDADNNNNNNNNNNKPFAKATKQKMVVGDGSMVPGWDRAIRTMTVGERAIVRVTDPTLGYGSIGVPPLIPSNSMLEFDVQILDAQEPTLNIDFDSIAMADNTPRTASAISAAYEQRQADKVASGYVEKEGLAKWIDKAQNFYFFGFFEGETGQEAPWFLRPSITFPIAFAIVGAAFYVSYIAGAIRERGAASVDELDEIIISSIMNAIADHGSSGGWMM